jgi:uncharacterized protein
MVFFHGVDVRYIDSVPRSVTIVPSAAILLVGTAPTFALAAGDVHVNDPVRCINDVDDARFGGKKIPGFTIPYALDALRDNGAGSVDIVNVFNPSTHKTTAQAVTFTFGADNKIQLTKVTGTAPSQVISVGTIAPGLTGTLTVTGVGGTPTYVLNTDYKVDLVDGVLTRVLGGAITALASVKVTYTYADPSLVTSADIIGAVVAGDRTGLQAGLDVYPLRGYRPKIIICPGFSELAGVATEMGVIAEKLKAYYLLDAPVAATRDEAIAGRAGAAPVATFGISTRRAMLIYGRVRDTEGILQPGSPYVAGVMADTDRRFGYWWSPSNKIVQGITAVEPKLTADFTDASTDVNALNAAGIVTFYNDFGTGYRVWGNRSALYPSDTTPLNFIPVGRTLDIFHESLQRACLPYVDRPINDPLIDAIDATGNNFIREQVTLGALINGSRMFYEPGKNPPSQLAAGKIVFSIALMIPTPAEIILLETTLDINLLANLGTSQEDN